MYGASGRFRAFRGGEGVLRGGLVGFRCLETCQLQAKREREVWRLFCCSTVADALALNEYVHVGFIA